MSKSWVEPTSRCSLKPILHTISAAAIAKLICDGLQKDYNCIWFVYVVSDQTSSVALSKVLGPLAFTPMGWGKNLQWKFFINENVILF